MTAAGKKAQPDEYDAGGEQGVDAGAVAAEQDNEQNEDGCKGQRPKNLDCRKIEIEMHFNLVWAAWGDAQATQQV